MKSHAAPQLAFQKTVLPNGLEILTSRQSRLPMVAVNLWYHVGSKNEERTQRGFAHLFEHLMFEGSQHYPGDYFKPLQKLGAHVNGSTSSDRTNYFTDLPSAHLELVLAMESDRMGFFLPAFTEEKLRIQRDVVKNEYRQNYANRPYGQVGRILAEAFYPPQHPYSWTTIGVMENLDAATHADVAAFFSRYYVPANASLSIVGDIDEDEAVQLALRYFGPIPGGVRALQPHVPTVSLTQDVHVSYYDRVELDRTYWIWHTVPQFHPDDAVLDILADILGGGKTSRLYQRLVCREERVQDVSLHHSSRELAGALTLSATHRPRQPWAPVRDAVLEEIRSVAVNGVTQAEVDRSIRQQESAFIFALDNIGGFGGIADRLNAYNIYLGNPGAILSDIERFRSVTPEAVQRLAQAYLHDRPRLELQVHGRNALRLQATGTGAPLETPVAEPPPETPLDRAVAPAPRSTRTFQPPTPEVIDLACGMPLWVIPRRDLPMTALTVAFRAGASQHPESCGGLAKMTASMLEEGTARHTSQALAEAIESLGSGISSSAGWDGCYLSATSLSSCLEETLDLHAEILTLPTFPEKEWTRMQTRVMAALRAQRDQPESLAFRGWLASVVPAGHPFRSPLDGRLDTIGAFARDQAIAFHQAQYRQDNGIWIASGNLDPSEIADILNRRLGDNPLPNHRRPADFTECPPYKGLPDAPTLVLIDRPASTQAVVRMGHCGPPRRHPDYHPLLLLNLILGGQFVSRLNTILREEKGVTYGIRSHFDFRHEGGFFSVTASLQADRLGEALADIRHQLFLICGEAPPTAQECAEAQRSVIEGQARSFETPSSLCSRYAGLFLHDLPIDDHLHFSQRIQAVTLDNLYRVAQQHLHPLSLTTVVVGDAQLLRPQLDALGWGAIVELSPQDL